MPSPDLYPQPGGPEVPATDVPDVGPAPPDEFPTNPPDLVPPLPGGTPVA